MANALAWWGITGQALEAQKDVVAEHGRITEDNFRDFTFANPVELHGAMNPAFFEGTVIEKAAAELLAKSDK